MNAVPQDQLLNKNNLKVYYLKSKTGLIDPFQTPATTCSNTAPILTSLLIDHDDRHTKELENNSLKKNLRNKEPHYDEEGKNLIVPGMDGEFSEAQKG